MKTISGERTRNGMPIPAMGMNPMAPLPNAKRGDSGEGPLKKTGSGESRHINTARKVGRDCGKAK